jgi:hypothetical protein
MRSKASIQKAVIGMVFALGLACSLPALAGSIGGTTVTTRTHVDVLNSPDQTIFANVQVERDRGPFKGDPAVTIDHYNHRAQNEDRPEDLGYGWTIVSAPHVVFPIYSQEYEGGRPCISCRPIDEVCELIGDRC